MSRGGSLASEVSEIVPCGIDASAVAQLLVVLHRDLGLERTRSRFGDIGKFDGGRGLRTPRPEPGRQSHEPAGNDRRRHAPADPGDVPGRLRRNDRGWLDRVLRRAHEYYAGGIDARTHQQFRRVRLGDALDAKPGDPLIEGFLDGPTVCERPIKRRSELDRGPVTDRPVHTDHAVDNFGQSLGLRAGVAGVQHDQPEIPIGA